MTCGRRCSVDLVYKQCLFLLWSPCQIIIHFHVMIHAIIVVVMTNSFHNTCDIGHKFQCQCHWRNDFLPFCLFLIPHFLCILGLNMCCCIIILLFVLVASIIFELCLSFGNTPSGFSLGLDCGNNVSFHGTILLFVLEQFMCLNRFAKEILVVTCCRQSYRLLQKWYHRFQDSSLKQSAGPFLLIHDGNAQLSCRHETCRGMQASRQW
mmetsp:Transcript_31541/g.57106  ORF Transcript_31541/g.57106 Transcript_31541/m.57106 type:complete len:208 (+) Transcript_31541:802-1425(+)